MSGRDEKLIHDVVRLHKEGVKWRAIARALRIGRNTVKDIICEHNQLRTQGHNALAPNRTISTRGSKLDPFRPRIDELLKTYPKITAQRVFEILRDDRDEKHYGGGYTMVKELVRKLRPKPPPKPSLETPPRVPADMAECDWSEYPVAFLSEPPAKLHAFGYTLRFSTRKYYGFQQSNGLHALMDEHLHAFERFGGAAHKCTYDSQKAVVLRWEGNQPLFNLRFIDFATYYEYAAVAVRHAPNRKPRVERSFWELTKSFFPGRSFRDRADLKAQLAHWLDTICDHRPLKRIKGVSRMQLFAQEQPLLRPLPHHPYDTARVLYKLCDIEGFIAWDGNWYSLPYDYVTEILPVRITETEFFVYKPDLTCIARHALRPKGAQEKAILLGHRPSYADRGPDLDQLRLAFENLGEPASAFLWALEKHQSRSAAYHARKILALRQGYDTDALLWALEHALEYGAVEHTAVERILIAKAPRRRLGEYVRADKANQLDAFSSAAEPRDLTEYDALPCRGLIAATQEGVNPCANEKVPTANPASQDPPPKSDNESKDTSNDSD